MNNDDDDWEMFIREEELHALVEAHETVEQIQEAIEDEFDYRSTHEHKHGSGTPSDREYAKAHAQPQKEAEFNWCSPDHA